MAIGEAFVAEETSSEANVSNTVEATESYDSTPVLEQGDWSGEFSGGNTLNTPAANADLPIIVGHSKFVRETASSRHVSTDVVQVNGVNQDIIGASSGRYVRRSGGADESASHGVGIVEPASGHDILVRRSTTFNGTDRVGTYDRSTGDIKGFWAAVLPDNDRLYASLNATAGASGRFSNSPRPIDAGPTISALSEGSWSDFDWSQDFLQGTAAQINGTNIEEIDLAANSKFLYLLTYRGDAGSDRNSVLVHTEVDRGGGFVTLEGGLVSTYLRNAGSDILCGNMQVPIITGGSAEKIRTRFVEQVEETIPEVAIPEAKLQIIDLTDADMIVVAHSTRISLVDNTWRNHEWNQEIHKDTASFAHSNGTNPQRITNDAGETITCLVGFVGLWDRSAATNSTRKAPHVRFRLNDGVMDYATAAEFSRGSQSGDDQFVAGFSCMAVVEIPSAQWVDVQYRDLASNTASDMIIANDLFTGTSIFWAARIDDLGAAPSVASLVAPHRVQPRYRM